MYMKFTSGELTAIVQQHLIEKFGIDPKAISKDLKFEIVDKSNRVVPTGEASVSAVSVWISTEEGTALPAGPYRTAGKR